MTIYPQIIQGGMGSGVSNWKLARAVSSLGQLGVVSGTALDQILIRRLQDGDPDGAMRRGFDAFPMPSLSEPLWDKYFIPGGKSATAAYRNGPKLMKDNPPEATLLCIVSNFVEVFLSRAGHDNPVGINYLEKIQTAHLPSIYGAMLAGVDYIIMGAGIPLKIPGVLDLFVNHQPAEYPLHVTGALEGDDFLMHFNPRDYLEREHPPLKRPRFLAIVASNTLATTMIRKANGIVDGLVVEAPIAGGHNAPPRNRSQFSETGEPLYGERDIVDFAKIHDLGVPFWLAGGYGRPGKLQEALALGATGIQVGTAFEFADESGLEATFKRKLLDKAIAGQASVYTDPLASPTGFPFKVAQLEGTDSDPSVYVERPRICDLGFLREFYRTPEGTVGDRCSAEPLSLYLSKGGNACDAAGRKCLCNCLLANIGQPQVRAGHHVEPALITAGNDLDLIPLFLPTGSRTYAAADVLEALLKPV